jgi:hypothetical protein
MHLSLVDYFIQSSGRMTTSDKMLCSLQREESANHLEKLKCALTIIVKKLNRKISHLGQNLEVRIQLK